MEWNWLLIEGYRCQNDLPCSITKIHKCIGLEYYYDFVKEKVIVRIDILEWSWIDHHCLSYSHPTRGVMGVPMDVDHHMILLKMYNNIIIINSRKIVNNCPILLVVYKWHYHHSPQLTNKLLKMIPFKSHTYQFFIADM